MQFIDIIQIVLKLKYCWRFSTFLIHSTYSMKDYYVQMLNRVYEYDCSIWIPAHFANHGCHHVYSTLETNWEYIDTELCLSSPLLPWVVQPIKELSPADAGDLLLNHLRAHLEHHNFLQSSCTSNDGMMRRSRKIEKVVEKLRLIKRLKKTAEVLYLAVSQLGQGLW